MPIPQSHPRNAPSPNWCAGRKVTEAHKAWLWKVLNDDPTCPSRLVLHTIAETQEPIVVTLRHINRLRKAWGLNRGKGRPRRAGRKKKSESQSQLVSVTPRLSCVGVQVLAHGLDQQQAFAPVVAQLTQAVQAYKQTHPGDDFALLHHRESTFLRRWQALFFAPVLDIDRLSEFDTHEHPLRTLLGRGYHSATLSQFLGQRARVGAAQALMPVLGADKAGQMIYVDGPMIASWSRRSMPKGTITMRGRLMAGSQAMIAHDETGQAVFVAYYPPDMHLSQVIVASCQHVALATDRALVVIDRAVNAVALAAAFDERGLGLLCLLDDNEHEGLESFDATEVDTLADGTRVYSGPWKAARKADPRHFVIVEPPADKTLVYWGTPQVQAVLAAREWPRVYRERNEIQELSFKGMINHGGLDINYGRKTILGPARHHQRQQAQRAQSLETAHTRVAKKAEVVTTQQDTVAQSEAKGHGKCLEQRQRTFRTLEQEFKEAQEKHAKLSEQATALGPAGQRADRDFRKQTIMTMRTLVLENMLRAFMVALLATLPTQVSLERVLRLLFERRGARMETPSQVVYWVNTDGLSLPNRRLLSEVVEGLCVMDLQDQGKPIHVRLKDMPP